MMENDSSDNEDMYGGTANLTGFLFGNIDSAGRLEDDIFDNETKRQLNSLSRFGLSSLIRDVLPDSTSPRDSNGSGSDDEIGTEGDSKADNAVDYSDITELADDDQTVSSQAVVEEHRRAGNESTDMALNKPAATATNDQPAVVPTDEKRLMPPPLIIPTTATPSDKVEGKESASEESTTPPSDRKLETPLAAMLPSKYANVDVRELFPDFRPDKVLRFSRLFGPGKPSSLPQIWRSVKNRRRSRKHSHDPLRPFKEDNDSGSEPDEPKYMSGLGLNFAPDPTPEMCLSDDEERLLREASDEANDQPNETGDPNDKKPKIADWRYGPAQVWYDLLDVPESGDGFNYGFKLRDPQDKKDDETKIAGEPIPDDAYLMVSQLHWEDDVVWDKNDIKNKVQQKPNSKSNAAGWLPSSGSRTAGAFNQSGKGTTTASAAGSKSNSTATGKSLKSQIIARSLQLQHEEPDDTWYSIFPVENEELIYSKWEDDVIWDAELVDKVPKPKVLTLDPNDENIILGIPDDVDPSKRKNLGPPPKVKIAHPHVKKSKILLGKAGVINVLAEDTPPPPPKSPDRDPFNISNDTFYMAKSSETTMRMKVGGGNLIQHSTPVVELRSPFIPTHMGPTKLRTFHRPALKKYSHGALAAPISHSVLPLLKHIRKKAKQREVERIASGGGDVFFMRNPEDLTGRDGDIILLEFCEEHPPLMNQVGMCSKIKNYYKRKAAKDVAPPNYKYGEIAYAHTSPFLGILQPGHCMQTVENNMYRAPIYPHTVLPTDFLVIRTRNNFFIREVDSMFTVGQECPLYEVFGPNSKRANNFTRDFLQVFVYRLFWKSTDVPRKIRMDHIKNAFPTHSESSIRKRLKPCADFKRTGMNSNWWVIKPEFRLPSEEEIRAMVSPEQCCAYFSMIAAEQRLKDAGYGEKFIFAQHDDDDEDMQMKMDDEVKVAPWNTTRAYIQAMRGKCLLQLTGPADPTGCGEGFSYVRIPNKPTQTKEEQENQPKRTVTGTDADLRRLSLSNAKALLRKFQVPEDEIKKLSRWEVIDVVRTLSTEKAKAGEEGMDKFSRGNRFSIAEHQERYKEECQRIFDLQNKVLSSTEVLSTDEDESTASEESDLEELGKNLENMLANKKTSVQLSLEREEQEREELLKKIMDGDQDGPMKAKSKKEQDEQQQQSLSQGHPGRVLKITRTFKNAEGREFSRVEYIRRQPVIDAYVKIRTTKDETFIKSFATMDEAQKEEMKREKRRLQEQLRRIKKNQERGHSGGNAFGGEKLYKKEVTPPRRKIKLRPDLKLKCGACGEVGHMRTNKACRLYPLLIPQASQPSVNVALTEEQEEEIERELYEEEDEEDLVNIDGTKVKLSGKLFKRHEDVKRRALLLKVPRDAVGRRKRRLGVDTHCDYLQEHNKPANRRRTDPVVVMSSILEEILNEMRDMPDVQPFLFPVNAKLVPDYYRIVQRPMDLQTIRENIRQKRYQSREEFLADVSQIVENSTNYNGPKNLLTEASQRMLQKCIDCMHEKEDRLMRLEKAINPLLDDDDQVALSFILEKLMLKLKTMPASWPFLKPVNKKQVKDYYTVIRRPMDLETATKKVAAHKYHSRQEFLSDIELIAKNCEQYNGPGSTFTAQAKELVEVSTKTLHEEFGDHCEQLEKNIALVQERARNESDMDMSWADDDNENMYDSRNSASPEPEEGDDEGGDKSITQLENKRGRGRPRKTNDLSADASNKPPGIKRGRGRPRKSSNNSQNPDDLHGTDEEDDEFEEVIETEQEATNLLIQGERIKMEEGSVDMGTGLSLETGMHDGGCGEDDDSQQAAMAMVQLSGFLGGQVAPLSQEESFDVDPNYDPSDFLAMSSIKKEPTIATTSTTEFKSEIDIDADDLPPMDCGAPVGIHDDLAVSDSDDEGNGMLLKEPKAEPITDNDNDEHIAGDSMMTAIEEIHPDPAADSNLVNISSGTNNNHQDPGGDGDLWF